MNAGMGVPASLGVVCPPSAASSVGAVGAVGVMGAMGGACPTVSGE